MSRLFNRRRDGPLGKTIQAIGIINTINAVNGGCKKVIIVCPNSLKTNWQNELKRWLTSKATIGIQYSSEPYIGDKVDVMIINYDIMGRFAEQTQATKWDAAILDEAHWVKNAKAQRSKATLAIQPKYRIALTGTPMPNKPIEIFEILKWLDDVNWGNWFAFGRRYCDAQHNGFAWDFSGASNLEELQREMRSTCMIRRLKSEVLTELPPKRRQIIELPKADYSVLVNREMVAYGARDSIIEDLAARLELAKASEDPEDYKAAARDLDEVTAVAFTEMAKARVDIGIAKAPAVIEILNETLMSGKVIVFAHHHEVVDMIKNAFPGCACITGKTPPKDRQNQVDRFQTDDSCRLFVGNTAAAEGLTLTAADQMVFAESQWVPGKLLQMEGRIDRLGQKRSMLITYIVVEGTIDSRMIRSCVEKMDVADKALDKECGLIDYISPPVPWKKSEVKPASPRSEEIDRIAKVLTQDDIDEIHRGLMQLAGTDQDYARTINNIGFSKIDVRVGHELANCAALRPRQAALGFILCRKYRKQLGEGVWTTKEIK